MNPRNKNLLFYCFIWLALTFNFKMDIAGSANAGFFDSFQFDGESLVVGRLIQSERYGIFSNAGFLGWIEPAPAGSNLYWHQYEAYHNPCDYDSYEAYYSQSGFQAFIYRLICLSTGLNGYPALDFLKWLVSFSTAFVFLLFIAWVQRRWGWATAFFVFVTVCFSQWVTVFGRNLFWVFSAFYLPFVAALWYLQKYEHCMKHSLRVSFWVMFAGMLLKCLLTGFEFITTTLVMAITPWVFYAVVEQWGWKRFLQRATVASAGVLTATLTALTLLAVQLSFIKGSFGEGFRYILFSFGKRTYGDADAFDPMFRESLNSNLWDVLTAYWKIHAFNLSHWFDHPLWQSVSKITFGFCVFLFMAVTLIVFQSKKLRIYPVFRQQQIALAAMLWVSLSAPLSWFVIFKGHSYIHTHMNPIVWYMPFMLIGATLTGSMLWFFFKIFRKHATEKTVDSDTGS